jgi:osmoprotectant transport system substrate-binding protein
MTHPPRRKMSINKLTAGLAVALGLVLAACGGDPTAGDRSASDTITIGSAAFPENEIIAEIYAQGLEAKGVKVKKHLNIGAREAYIPAMKNGEIDLLPEYTGNLLQYIDKTATASAPDDVVAAVEKALPDGLEILDVSKAENKDSLNVTPEFAADNAVRTIGDLAKIDGLRLGANPEFKTRRFGLPGMEKLYGVNGVKFTGISDGGGPATLKALLDDKVDVVDIYSTTPSILANKLVTLEDPEDMFAAQNVVPLVKDDKDSNTVENVLNSISAQLTTADLVDLNSRNQGPDKTAPAILAKDWLTAKGLI